MKHIVIGMAGHIDHGKTALIRALTGIQTDQLPQEQERGITIDLGFAYWKPEVTIIDVPGHEKFIRNMVAGVNTVDLFLLVIAADDGIMPQTREHLEILKFFNVQKGIVALNKTDLVEPEWLELVKLDIREFLDRHELQHVQIVPVSSVTNFGIETLQQKLEQLIVETESTKSSKHRPFRLNIDRSFDAKGFGNIVTGTVLSGSIGLGQQLSVLPQDIPFKVRGLQVHQKDVKSLLEGQRAAINLSGNAKLKLQRGQTLVQPGNLKPTRTLIAKIKTTSLFQFRIKRLSAIRVHLGTAEVKGTINWYEDHSSLLPETEYSAIIKFAEPAVAVPGDAILLRSYSPVTTIAGGRVIQINPPTLIRKSQDWQNHLNVLDSGTLTDRVKLFFEDFGFFCCTLNDLQVLFFEEPEELEQIVEKLKKQKVLTLLSQQEEKKYLLSKKVNQLIDLIANELEAHQQKQKIALGLHAKEIPALLPAIKAADCFWNYTLEKGARSKKIYFDGLLYFANTQADERPTSQADQKLAGIYLKAAFIPPSQNDLLAELGLSKPELNSLIQKSLRNGDLISINARFYIHKKKYEQLLNYLRDQFEKKNTLDVADIRTFTQSSRKYLIPLLEYTDAKNFTRREGDTRVKGTAL